MKISENKKKTIKNYYPKTSYFLTLKNRKQKTAFGYPTCFLDFLILRIKKTVASTKKLGCLCDPLGKNKQHIFFF